MILTIVSGMGWSTYWADNFSSFAEAVTPGDPAESTTSTSAVRGDLDRFGNQIPWASGDFPIPASYAPESTDGSMPSPLPLDQVVRIAEEEGMRPGYTINFPANEVDEAGNPVMGSFSMYNSWPRTTGEAVTCSSISSPVNVSMSRPSTATARSLSAWTTWSAPTWAPSSGCSAASS